MKFIICQSCHEPMFLRRHKVVCECGSSSGKYLEDGLKAVISGPCTAFGIHSSDLGWWLRNTQKGIYPERFDGDIRAWCMPEFPANIERVEHVDD